MWGSFLTVFNAIPQSEADEQEMLQSADDTFSRFGDLFLTEAAV